MNQHEIDESDRLHREAFDEANPHLIGHHIHWCECGAEIHGIVSFRRTPEDPLCRQCWDYDFGCPDEDDDDYF